MKMNKSWKLGPQKQVNCNQKLGRIELAELDFKSPLVKPILAPALVTSLVPSPHLFHHLTCSTNAGVSHLTFSDLLCNNAYERGDMMHSVLVVDSDELDPDAWPNVKVPNCIPSTKNDWSRLMTQAHTWVVSRAPPVCIHIYICIYIYTYIYHKYMHTHTHTHARTCTPTPKQTVLVVACVLVRSIHSHKRTAGVVACSCM